MSIVWTINRSRTAPNIRCNWFLWLLRFLGSQVATSVTFLFDFFIARSLFIFFALVDGRCDFPFAIGLFGIDCRCDSPIAIGFFGIDCSCDSPIAIGFFRIDGRCDLAIALVLFNVDCRGDIILALDIFSGLRLFDSVLALLLRVGVVLDWDQR
jgi:hypothetical protein